MTLTNIAKARRTCRNKTMKGNIYCKKKEAVKAAEKMRRDGVDKPIEVFRCPICGNFHIGGKKNDDTRQASCQTSGTQEGISDFSTHSH